MNILIDDERTIFEVRHMIPHITLDQGFEFDSVVRSFQDAIQMSATITDNDVLFLDHDLGTDEPGIDGHGVIKHLRDACRYPYMVIIVSANPIGLRNIENVLINDMGFKKTSERVYSR